MLKRIYVDNYKTLVNFELEFDEINLILGKNGSGKTAIFEVLMKLQNFMMGNSQKIYKSYQVSQIFQSENKTRWQDVPIQRFELEIEGNGGVYCYRLEIEHTKLDKDPNPSRMRSEQLLFNKQTLFEFWINNDSDNPVGQSKLYHDDPEQEPLFSTYFDWSRSGISVYDRQKNQKLTWFKKRIEDLFIVHANPFSIKSESDGEDRNPNWEISNYSAWYRHLSQEHQSKVFKLTLELQKVIKGFDSFTNKQTGDRTRNLLALFSQGDAYELGELSDGLKVLIILYTLIYCTPDEDCTIFIDEPENFLALPEIQPWLGKLIDRCFDSSKQAILISHHPSLINHFTDSSAYWFERQDNAGTRVKKIVEDNSNDGISLAKLIELKWIYDE